MSEEARELGAVERRQFAEKKIREIGERLSIDAYNDVSTPAYVGEDVLFLWHENQALISRVAKAEGWDA